MCVLRNFRTLLIIFAITAGTALAAPQPVFDCITPSDSTTTGTTTMATTHTTKTAPSTTPLLPTKPAGESEPTPTAEPNWRTIAATWRSNLGKPAWAVNGTLIANALKTARDGNGKMVHELNPGSFGQVLAPGHNYTDESFYSAFVGGWLCEMPDLPGLGDTCEDAGRGWAHGDTGHAEILSSEDYNSIGCAWAMGIWACDLGHGI